MDGGKGVKRKREANNNPLRVENARDFVNKMSPVWAIKPPTSGEDLLIKITYIRTAIRYLRNLKSSIVKNPPDTWDYAYVPKIGNEPGKRVNFNDRVATSYIDKAIYSLGVLLQDTIVLEQTNRSLAATTMTPGEGERCGDGNCYIQFVNIGLGDCTTISSPYGFRIMIDMGSTAMTDIKLNWESNPGNLPSAQTNKIVLEILRDTIKRKIFLGDQKMINMLILTHTDEDHHNKLSRLGAAISLGRVYYSGPKLEKYVRTSSYIKNRVPKTGIKKVDLRVDKDTKEKVRTIDDVEPPTLKSSAKMGYPDNEYIDEATGAIVLYEEDNGFKISILASNVTGVNVDYGDSGKVWTTNDALIKTDPREFLFKKDSTDPNRGSQVVLVEFNGKKAIITGDATAVTEYFLATEPKYAAILQNVDAYRLPHHGSPTSSSMKILDKLVGVKEAVASTSGRYTRIHGLPKQDILNLYNPPASGDAHSIWAFPLSKDEGASTLNAYTKKVYATGSNGTRIYKF